MMKSVAFRLVTTMALLVGMAMHHASGAAEEPAAMVLTERSITIDGNLEDWEHITAEQTVRDPRGQAVATFKLAYDTEHLYAAFAVKDASPMRNSSVLLQELLKGGDAVGICLGAAGNRGHLQRILAAIVDDKPVLMAYRPSWPVKRPHTFASPVSELPMDYVGPIDGAQVAFRLTDDGYQAEMLLPWRELGVQPNFSGTIPFDVQVIFSDPAGSVNESTAWWHTAGGGAFTTEDLPTEAALYPDHWGVARLYQRDPGPRAVEQAEVEVTGIPITFTMPRDARVSLIITDADGWIVRELLRAESRASGEHTIYWDGRDRYDEALPPADYTWRAAVFDGMGTRFHGSIGNSARPPYRTVDGKGSMGGQHGGPSVLAADASGIYILGGAEEGHPAMRKIDRDGYTLWKRSMGGFGSGAAAATDGGFVYLLQGSSRGDSFLVRLNPESGAERAIAEGVTRLPITETRKRIGGMAVIGDRAYISLPEEDRIQIVDLAAGSLAESIEIAHPLGLVRWNDAALLVCSGSEVKEIALADGTIRTLVDGLEAPRALAVDTQGRLYISDLGTSQQIKVFEEGQLRPAIGTPGGRAATVLQYDPHELQNVVGLAVDAENHIWAVEQSSLRRVARFAADGTHQLDLHGPVAYNVFGPDLDDFSQVYYQGAQGTPIYMKARIDYDRYRADPLRGSTEAWRIESVFSFMPEAGEEVSKHPMSAAMAPGYGHVVAFTASNGHRYLWRLAKSNRASNPAGAAIWRWTEAGWTPAAFVSNNANQQSWSDTNGDGRIQADEMYAPPPTRHFAWLDRDLVLYGWAGTLAPSRIDERGVPFYDDAERYSPYLAQPSPLIGSGWVFNSMPDATGAIYYAGNYGPHRHAAGAWDRASENRLIKVQDGRVQWAIGQHDALARNEGDMNTVTGIAGIVGDILIAHIVEPARYIAFTTDGFTLGNVIVDASGQQPRVGPNAIYIESFTGLFLEDPQSGKPLLFAVSSGDDRILEVTGPGNLTRQEGQITLPGAFPREPHPIGQTVIPYETWYGNVSRGYGIDGEASEWQPTSTGLAIEENGAIVGDIRMRRDAGALYLLASVLAPSAEAAIEGGAPEALWGRVDGVELMLGPARPIQGREAMPGDTRIFLTFHGGKAAALYRRTDHPDWRPIPQAKVGMVRRWNGYGWRLEAEIPLEILPELATMRLQTFRRPQGNNPNITTRQEERLDLAGPMRFNAAFHLHDGQSVRRLPWVDDGGSLDRPEFLQPSRWGAANTLVELWWAESTEASAHTIYRAPADDQGAVEMVATGVTRSSHVDTPGPGDFVYWLAPHVGASPGQPIGPLAIRESRIAFPPVEPVAPYPFDEIGDLIVYKPFRGGLLLLDVEADELVAEPPDGVQATPIRQADGLWLVAVTLPPVSAAGTAYAITLRAGQRQATFAAVVGIDMMAGLATGSMAPGEEFRQGWIRQPDHDADGSPRHLVRVIDSDGKPAPSIEMLAWNSDNTISYPLEAAIAESHWHASGHLRLISRAGGTTIGIRVFDRADRPIADLHFGRHNFASGASSYLSLQGEYVIQSEDAYGAAVGQWQPFAIHASEGMVEISYGEGTQQYRVERAALSGSSWNEPARLEVYLGGQTSGRHLRVDNLRFISK